MNNITNRKRLQDQLEKYQDYLPYCKRESQLKLIAEILKLSQKITVIGSWNLEKLQEQTDDYFITKPSKINQENEQNNFENITLAVGRNSTFVQPYC